MSVIISLPVIILACSILGVVLAFVTKPKSGRNQARIAVSRQSRAALPMYAQIYVRIVDKRIVTVNTPDAPGAEYSISASHHNLYYMTFEAQDGTRTEMCIPEAVFCGCLAGFVGTLRYRNTPEGQQFIDFTRDIRYRVNGL